MTEPNRGPATAGGMLRAAREKQGLHIAALAAGGVAERGVPPPPCRNVGAPHGTRPARNAGGRPSSATFGRAWASAARRVTRPVA